MLRRSERNSAPLRWTTSAFSLRTRTTARRDDTTQSGSKLALSKSARATGTHLLGRKLTGGLRKRPAGYGTGPRRTIPDTTRDRLRAGRSLRRNRFRGGTG